jgi:hypothetical protein
MGPITRNHFNILVVITSMVVLLLLVNSMIVSIWIHFPSKTSFNIIWLPSMFSLLIWVILAVLSLFKSNLALLLGIFQCVTSTSSTISNLLDYQKYTYTIYSIVPFILILLVFVSCIYIVYLCYIYLLDYYKRRFNF